MQAELGKAAKTMPFQRALKEASQEVFDQIAALAAEHGVSLATALQVVKDLYLYARRWSPSPTKKKRGRNKSNK